MNRLVQLVSVVLLVSSFLPYPAVFAHKHHHNATSTSDATSSSGSSSWAYVAGAAAIGIVATVLYARRQLFRPRVQVDLEAGSLYGAVDNRSPDVCTNLMRQPTLESQIESLYPDLLRIFDQTPNSPVFSRQGFPNFIRDVAVYLRDHRSPRVVGDADFLIGSDVRNRRRVLQNFAFVYSQFDEGTVFALHIPDFVGSPYQDDMLPALLARLLLMGLEHNPSDLERVVAQSLAFAVNALLLERNIPYPLLGARMYTGFQWHDIVRSTARRLIVYAPHISDISGFDRFYRSCPDSELMPVDESERKLHRRGG